MKKTTIAAALLALSMGFGCQDRRGREQAKAGSADLEVFSEDEVQEVPVASDLDFEQAVEAYQVGDYDFAARRIEEGTASLKDETKNSTGALRDDTQAIIAKLETLAERVRQGRIKSPDELRKTFNQAELLVVHSYFILNNFYLDRRSDNQASFRMTEDLKALEAAVRHGDARLKAEAKPLIAASRRLIEEEEKRGQLDVEKLKKQSDKLIDFLERHTAGI